MARTLVIKNANFSTNKIEAVTLNDKSCTAISLDVATASITSIGGTASLTATVTPADTTDEIIWTSSDDNVAMVENGTVTAVGCGTATITATCGEYSDSCVVTVTHVATLTYSISRILSKATNKNYLTGGTLANYAIGYSSTGTYKVSYDDRNESRYPFIIPNGSNQIVITCTNFKPYGFWLDSTQAASGTVVAIALTKDSFGNSQSSWGNRTVAIPDKTGDYVNLDSVGFVFAYNGTLESESALEEITVTFTHAEPEPEEQ